MLGLEVYRDTSLLLWCVTWLSDDVPSLKEISLWLNQP